MNDITLQLWGIRQKVDLYLPLSFIIGDVEGGDALSGHNGSKGRTMNGARLCRTCDISTAHALVTN